MTKLARSHQAFGSIAMRTIGIGLLTGLAFFVIVTVSAKTRTSFLASLAFVRDAVANRMDDDVAYTEAESLFTLDGSRTMVGEPETMAADSVVLMSSPTCVPNNTPDSILYAQNTNGATPGVNSQDYDWANQFDDVAADDFVVPAGQLWNITKVDVFGTDDTVPPSGFDIEFYQDSATLPGVSIASFPNHAFVRFPPGNGIEFSMTLPAPVVLGPGTYWLSVRSRGEGAFDTAWAWVNTTVTSNSGAVWKNPPDGHGTGCTTWVRKTTCLPSSTGPDQMFVIRGTSGCGAPAATSTSTSTNTPTATSTNTFTPTATATNTFTPTATATPLCENFDSVTAPALPAGWSTTASGAGVPWVTSTTTSDTAPNAAFVPNAGQVSLTELSSPQFGVSSSGGMLTFRNNFITEGGYDGVVLEISINGGAFADIITAGGSFVSGGYNGTLAVFSNPLGGRAAWTGNSLGYITTSVTLPSAANGQNVQLKWRLGTDHGNGAPGIYIDTICLSLPNTPTNTPTNTSTATNTATSTATATPLSTLCENFDSVSAPALPAGWTTAASGGEVPWVTSTNAPHTTPNGALGAGSSGFGETSLFSPVFSVSSGGAMVTFRNDYVLEADSIRGYDGAVLEISINGGAFADIVTAGGSFVSGGYNLPITSNYGNPLGGRMAWTGNSSGFITSSVVLPSAANGQSVQLRWRLCVDQGNASPGIQIDTLCVSLPNTPTSTPTGTGTATNTATSTATATPLSALCENFDSVTSPALPTGWTTAASGGEVPWVTSTNAPNTAPNGALGAGSSAFGETSLVSPVFSVSSGGAMVTFKNDYVLEADSIRGYDGAVLEISINGGPFDDIVTAGGSFLSGGYNLPITSNYGSPLGGRMAWTGNSAGFITSSVVLPAAANGQSVQLRWRLCVDQGNASPGIQIDTLCVSLPNTPTNTPTNTGTATSTATSTATATPLSFGGICGDNFDSVTAPSLPAGWSTTATGAGVQWATSTTSSDTAPNAAFAPNVNEIGLTELLAPEVAVPSGGGMVTFRNSYDTEYAGGNIIGYDGTVLEISINGGAFTDIITAGGSFVTGGYNNTLSSNYGNPLSGRQAWTGQSFGFITTAVTLPSAANGQSVRLRWLLGTDHGNAAPGVRIDSPCVSASVSGMVTYGNAASPPKYISNVTVTGSGSPNISTTTFGPGANAGKYILTGFTAGSHTVSLSKTTGQNGIASADAARIAQHVANTGPGVFTNANQKIAADVTGNGVISSQDAAKIAQVVAGLPLSSPNFTGQWRFFVPPGPTFPIGSSPTSRTYSSLTGNMTGEDWIGLLIGEVTGNWAPSAARPGRRSAAVGGPERRIEVELPNLSTALDKDIVVPVSVQGIADKNVTSYEFDVRYDPSIIQPLGDVADLKDTASRGLSVVTNATEPGLLRIVVYGPRPIEGDGVLLNLRFTAVGLPGTVSPLVFERIMFNEGEPGVATTDGQVELSAAAPNQAELTGRVVNPMGQGIANARVTLTDTLGQTRSVVSNGFGAYRFGGLTVGQTYTVSASGKATTFTPLTVSITASSMDVDLIAAF